MPYGGGPKSGCACRFAVGFVDDLPLMKLMNAAEFESSGAALTSRFHQLSALNTWRPTSEPSSTGGAAADNKALAASSSIEVAIQRGRRATTRSVSPTVPAATC